MIKEENVEKNKKRREKYEQTENLHESRTVMGEVQ